MPRLDNGLPGHAAHNVIQNVTDKNSRTAKRGPAVTHRRIGNDKPAHEFAHRGSPLSSGCSLTVTIAI